jgi:MSHA biogenesis protein MshP
LNAAPHPTRRAARLPHTCARTRWRGRPSQRGVSALLVLAVLVMLASITTYAVSLVTSAASSQARQVSHSRAQQAAQAGLQWAQWRVRVAATPQCPANAVFNALPGQLAPYRAIVSCTLARSTTEGGAPVNIYRLDVTACNAAACPQTNPAAGYVEHRLSALVAR